MNFSQIRMALKKMMPPRPPQKKQLMDAMMTQPKPTLQKNLNQRNKLLRQAQGMK